MGTPPPILLDTLSMPDTIILMILALVVFGPRRLPQIGRQIGKLMYEFRKASNDFKFQMEEELRNAEEADRRKKEEEERQRALAAAPPAPQIEATTSVPAEPGSASSHDSIGIDLNPSTPPSDASTAGSPNEMTVPDSIAGSNLPIEPSTAPEPEATAAPAAETSSPRIMPPSTGETVAADGPGSSRSGVVPEAERSEPATHHG